METKTQSIAFISGHLDLSAEQFRDHYVPYIQKAIEQGHSFVLGSARGADTMALDFLLEQKVNLKKRITVYVFSRNGHFQSKTIKRLLHLGVKVNHGFMSDTERDEACTKASTYDIAWVRPKEETAKLLGAKYDPNRLSGTEQNLIRRKKMASG